MGGRSTSIGCGTSLCLLIDYSRTVVLFLCFCGFLFSILSILIYMSGVKEGGCGFKVPAQVYCLSRTADESESRPVGV